MTNASLLFALILTAASAAGSTAPNVVIIYTDDLGYGDPACYGGKAPTPNVDQLAREGIRFTDFYVAQAVCTASRAALLTGCYSNRVGLLGALSNKSQIGLNPNETTVAEMLRTRGYRTSMVGKWHLGHHPDFLPTRHGFDEWLGLPYSNDMWPANSHGKFPPLPLFEGDRVIDPDVTANTQTDLLTRYAERAVRFIDEHASEPFFLYFAPAMPHVPLFVSEKHRGKSGAGTYGDVIMEIDWAVGEIMAALARRGLDKNTLVIFSSDNGPWSIYGDHAGSSGPLRNGKQSVFEGGVRVPFLSRDGQVKFRLAPSATNQRRRWTFCRRSPVLRKRKCRVIASSTEKISGH